MFKQAKKQLVPALRNDAITMYTKEELGSIENALINIEPFIEYKKSEFAKKWFTTFSDYKINQINLI